MLNVLLGDVISQMGQSVESTTDHVSMFVLQHLIRSKIVLQGTLVALRSSSVYFCTHDVIMMQKFHLIMQYLKSLLWWICMQWLEEGSTVPLP